MFGMLFIIFSQNFGMLLTGYIIVGLSVGADIPASWTTIAEGAPAKERAKHCGTAQLAWSAGPIIVLILSVALGNLGILGSRIVFGHLFVVALITWLIRRSLPESQSWLDQKQKEKQLEAKGQSQKVTIKDILKPVNFKSILFLLGVYLFWNLAAAFMVGFLIISGIIGVVFAPKTSGRTLEAIEKERYGEMI